MSVPDPDRLLSHIRQDIRELGKAELISSDEGAIARCLALDVAALDKHLTEGGPLPKAWRPKGWVTTAWSAAPETEPVTGSSNLMGSQADG